MTIKKTRVLFLCTGNSARSQMAEALLRWHGGRFFKAYSGGIEPRGLHPLTIRVMNEIGYDMSDHSSKSISGFIGTEQFDYLITVCDSADQNCPVFPGMGERIHWSFEDPATFVGSEAEKIEKFREIRNLIDRRILDWLESLGIQAAN